MPEFNRVSRDVARRRAILLLRDAAATVIALLLVFAAADDITTDSATQFPVEYTILIACGGWLLFLAVRLLRERYLVLGSVSLLALVIAAWGQRAIRPGITPGLWPEYVATTAAFVWFWTLSFILLWRGWRDHPERDRENQPCSPSAAAK